MLCVMFPIEIPSYIYDSSVPLIVGGLLIMGMFSWLRPGARISFHSAKDNNLTLTKKAGKSGVKEKVTLTDLCRSVTPKKCHLNPFLFNGHLQTAWTTVKFAEALVYYKRWMFEADNPMYNGHFAIDFVVKPYEVPTDGPLTDPERKFTQPTGLPERTSFFSPDEFSTISSADSKPMLVLLHGLSGGSHEDYLRRVVAPIVADGSWEACVVNSRGCAQTKITSGVLYNARATWDVRQAVAWLRRTFPNRPLFGIGFSLGANILANYLGEEGEAAQMKAAVLVASPWNLETASVQLQSSMIGLNVYQKVMGASMKQLFATHVDEISKNPRVDVEAVKKITYLYEFDRALQCSTWGYPSEGAYYRDAATIDSLFGIRIPFFSVQAEDDPIVSFRALPYQEITETPYGVMMATSWGGHLGWFEFGGDRWFVKPVTNFLNAMAKEVDLETPFDVQHPAKVHGIPVGHAEPCHDPDTAPKPSFSPMRRKLGLKLTNPN